MALINCKECGKEVSTEAKVCPHCGFKQPKKTLIPGVSNVFAWVIIVIMVPIIFVMIFSESPQASAEKFNQAKAECSQIAAKAGLAAPGSFDRTHEAVATKIAIDCMESRGFKVEFK